MKLKNKLLNLFDISILTNKSYLQAKWDYFAELSKYLVILGALSSLGFLGSDAMIIGSFPAATILPRLTVVPFAVIYLIVHKKVRGYRVKAFCTLLMCHIIHWCTTWAAVNLPDYSYVGEGIIVMHLLFFGASYGAPFIMSTVMHLCILLNIIIPNIFMDWLDIGMAMAMNIPIIAGVTCLRGVDKQLTI